MYRVLSVQPIDSIQEREMGSCIGKQTVGDAKKIFDLAVNPENGSSIEEAKVCITDLFKLLKSDEDGVMWVLCNGCWEKLPASYYCGIFNIPLELMQKFERLSDESDRIQDECAGIRPTSDTDEIAVQNILKLADRIDKIRSELIELSWEVGRLLDRANYEVKELKNTLSGDEEARDHEESDEPSNKPEYCSPPPTKGGPRHRFMGQKSCKGR